MGVVPCERGDVRELQCFRNEVLQICDVWQSQRFGVLMSQCESCGVWELHSVVIDII